MNAPITITCLVTRTRPSVKMWRCEVYSHVYQDAWRDVVADADTGACRVFDCSISCVNAEWLKLQPLKSLLFPLPLSFDLVLPYICPSMKHSELLQCELSPLWALFDRCKIHQCQKWVRPTWFWLGSRYYWIHSELSCMASQHSFVASINQLEAVTNLPQRSPR